MCQPCSDFNINLTAFKDQQHVGSIYAVDQKIQQFREDNNVVGCALGIVCDNRIHYLKGYGLARQGGTSGNLPFGVGTSASVGSISKTLTALGILRLYERGFLNLEDYIDNYIPFAPNGWEQISILDLLAHKSGLATDPTWGFPSTEEDLKMKFSQGGAHPGAQPRFAYFGYRNTPKTPHAVNPGTGKVQPPPNNYSNIGYALLGAIIDFVTTDQSNDFLDRERGYENFIWWNVGMKGGNTSNEVMQSICLNAYWRQSEILNLAFDYPQDNSSFSGSQYTGWEGPAGGWTMTIGDLARLMIMINTNQIISRATKEDDVMRSYGGMNVIPPAVVGLGLFRTTSNEENYFSQGAFLHPGSIGHYGARYTMWPEEGFGVALMFNSQVSLEAHEALTLDIAQLFLGQSAYLGCGINDIVFEDADIRQMQTASFQLVNRYRREVLDLIHLYQYREGDLERAVRAMIRDGLGEENGRKIIESIRSGEMEVAARLALQVIQKRFHKLEGPGAGLPKMGNPIKEKCD